MLHSSLAPAVDISDTMMIILIIHTLFPSTSPNPDAGRLASEAPRTSERTTRMRRENSLGNLKSPSQFGGTTRTKSVADGEFLRKTIEGSNDISELHDSSSSTEAGSLKNEMFWTPEAQLPAFDKRVVFLRRGPVYHVPHVMYCVPISEAIALVFICKVGCSCYSFQAAQI